MKEEESLYLNNGVQTKRKRLISEIFQKWNLCAELQICLWTHVIIAFVPDFISHFHLSNLLHLLNYS